MNTSTARRTYKLAAVCGATVSGGAWLQHSEHESKNYERILLSRAEAIYNCILTTTYPKLFASIHTVSCESQSSSSSNSQDDSSTEKEGSKDSYPDFSRHGKNSPIQKYLTPQVYNALRQKQTSNGVCLEDMIRAAVTLPWGAKPPRGIAGVYAGDAESYAVFNQLLDPIIVDHHHSTTISRTVLLQRHQTNLNPQSLIHQQLDPSGEYILFTRMRLARSLKGFCFSPCISRSERRKVERIVRDCIENDDFWDNQDKDGTKRGKYESIMSMTNEQHDDLIQRHLLFADPDEFALSAGTHRDWPNGRGIYLDDWEDTPKIMLWVNNEDHVWIMSNDKSGDVQSVFTRLSTAVHKLEESLKARGYSFCEDRQLGFLNASPANIGPALRASVYVKLVLLGRQPGFHQLLQRLRLDARAEYDEQNDTHYTGIFHIANAETLGKTEVDLINVMIMGVARLIEIEKRLEKGENINLDNE